MKTILRAVFLNSLVLYLAVLVYQGLRFDGTLKTLVIAAVALTLLNKIVKPVIKLLLLPINLLTLGIFSWVATVLTMIILTRIVSGISIIPYDFRGFSYSGFVVPAFHFGALWSYILASATISLTHTVVSWILRK